MISASEREYLIRTGKTFLDIRDKYLTRAFSSEVVRYCWRVTFSCLKGSSACVVPQVVGGTLVDSDRATYVLGFEGSRPSHAGLTRLSVTIG
jgi:hypothetical protein